MFYLPDKKPGNLVFSQTVIKLLLICILFHPMNIGETARPKNLGPLNYTLADIPLITGK